MSEQKPIQISLASEWEALRERDPRTNVPLFAPGQAIGAIPNGTRVRKCNTMTSDSFYDGDGGTVLASHSTDGAPGAPHPFMYFVEFDKKPGLPVLILGNRITA